MNRVPTPKDWREAVRASSVPRGVKLLAAYLAEPGRMRTYQGIPRYVSIPRYLMAEDLAVPLDTLKRWVREAHRAGVLVTLSHAHKGRDAEYQGMMPPAPALPGDTPGITKSNTSQRSGMGVIFDPLCPVNSSGENGENGAVTCLRGSIPIEVGWSPSLTGQRADARHQTSGVTLAPRCSNRIGNSGADGRVAGSTSRPPSSLLLDLESPQDYGDRGHLAAVPPLDRSRQATDERAQLIRGAR